MPGHLGKTILILYTYPLPQNHSNFVYLPITQYWYSRTKVMLLCKCWLTQWFEDFFAFFLASGIQPVMVSLRRSHTNVSDFTHGGRGVKGGGYCRPRVEPRYWNEGCELQTTGMTYALARSRSNIAALGLNPEAVYHRNPHQINQIPGKEFFYNLLFCLYLGSFSLVYL